MECQTREFFFRKPQLLVNFWGLSRGGAPPPPTLLKIKKKFKKGPLKPRFFLRSRGFSGIEEHPLGKPTKNPKGENVFFPAPQRPPKKYPEVSPPYRGATKITGKMTPHKGGPRPPEPARGHHPPPGPTS